MAQITLLDGSLGQELVKRSGDQPTPLWSTQVMIDHPDLLGEVYADYFSAGATVVTSNTYAVLRDRLQKYGSEDQFEHLTEVAMQLARKACDATGHGRVAGSFGPIGASYRPDICPPPGEAAQIYAEHVTLMKPHVDLFLLETMSSVDQAAGGLLATCGHGKPVWLAVTVKDEDGAYLRSGEPVSALAGVVAQYRPDAVLVNCSRPEAVTEAMGHIKALGMPFGAYANGFTRISEAFLGTAPTVDVLEARRDLDPAAYAEFVMRWVSEGATIVGGCCEVGPAHIAEIARRLQDAGHVIV
ncbi:MAG: homocysteine S-methyltransferase family protein [Pseudomonadota bacterium]